MPGHDEGESTKERIERLLGEGKITEEAVATAERLWEDRLRHGILIPNGETFMIMLGDLYHALVDPRIWRKPERIERALLGIFEIRTGNWGRRKALSRWEEDGKPLLGRVIIDTDNTLRSLHLIDEKGLRRELAKGDLLWKQ